MLSLSIYPYIYLRVKIGKMASISGCGGVEVWTCRGVSTVKNMFFSDRESQSLILLCLEVEEWIANRIDYLTEDLLLQEKKSGKPSGKWRRRRRNSAADRPPSADRRSRRRSSAQPRRRSLYPGPPPPLPSPASASASFHFDAPSSSSVNNGHFELAAENERRLELNFTKTFPDVVWTGREETDTSIEVALVDSLTGQVVNSGSEASAIVQIVVVESEFNGKNWTKEEFNSKIVKVREKNGRKIAILAGDFHVNLEGGIGVLGHVKFTQNRIWMEKHEFRLGARIVDDDGSHGIRVREAITEPFTLRDKRLKVWQKHRPPCPSDQVWRLDMIGRNGAFHKRLSGKHIYTVKDFVAILHINSEWLKG
ncbi:unnamed protein product [Camellia sinensis]